MMSDELIEKLKDIQKRNGAPLPVVMWTGGDVNYVEQGYDNLAKRDEIWLFETR